MNYSSFIPKQRERAYVQPFDGKFEIATPEGTPGARSRVNKQGKTVWGIATPTLSGYITDVDKRDSEYGSTLDVTFESADGREDVFLRVPFGSSLAAGFLNRMLNVDFTRPVEFSISRKEGRDTLFVKNGGHSVKYAHTRENPNGRPEWIEYETPEGTKKWSNTAQLSFFAEVLEKEVRPRVLMAASGRGGYAEVERPAIQSAPVPVLSASPEGQQDSDDLPF